MTAAYTSPTGFTFTPYEVEYEVLLTEEQAAIIRKPTRLVYSLNAYLGPALRHLDLKIADNGQWALYITLNAVVAVPDYLGEIGDLISAALAEGEDKA